MGEYEPEGDPEEGEGLPFRFYLPPELEAGVYAHTVAVWHTGYDFTLDFAVMEPPQLSDPADPNSPPEIPTRIVSRIRIPPTLVFDLIRTINARMEAYEAEWGEIQRLEPREPEEGGE